MGELPLYGPPKVGGDILAYCGTCKGELAHVVFSMVDRKPAKVVCKTCKGQHNYRRIGDTTSRTTSRTPRASSPKREIVRADEYWDQKMAKMKGKAMKPYSPKEHFEKEEVINHTLFGVGIVEEVKLGGKIVVLFRGGEKLLVHKA